MFPPNFWDGSDFICLDFKRILDGRLQTQMDDRILRTISMKQHFWPGKAALGLAILAGLLSGCVTRIEYRQPSPVYAPPPVVQPAPEYVPPPPAQPLIGYTTPAPAPVYVPAPAQAEVVVDIHTESDFYQPLQPYGRWIDVRGYGRCWTPAGVDPDWRPYTDGHWQRTDAGWYWVSDEPWGWATCHYGRWHREDNFGWVWIPQTQWAPAWVAWREGGGYTGWAPLPPEARIGPNGTLEPHEENIDPSSFAFVEQRRMLEPQRRHDVIVNNTTIINQTVNITKIVVVNETIINEGPRPDAVAQATGRKIEVVPAQTLRVRQEAPAVAQHQLNRPGSEKNTTPNLPPSHNPVATTLTREPVVRPDEPMIASPTTPQPVFARPNGPVTSNEVRPAATNTVFRSTPRTTTAVQPVNQLNQLRPESGQPARQLAPGQVRQEQVRTNLPAEHGQLTVKPATTTGQAKPESGQLPRQTVPEQIKPDQNFRINPAKVPAQGVAKPGAAVLTDQQKHELEQKQKAEAKQRLGAERPYSQSSTNAPAPVR